MIINKQTVYLHAIVILSVKETISLYTECHCGSFYKVLL